MAVTVTAEEKTARENELRELLRSMGMRVQLVETRKNLLDRVNVRVPSHPLDAADLRTLLDAGLRIFDLAQMGDLYSLDFDSALTRKEAAAAARPT